MTPNTDAPHPDQTVRVPLDTGPNFSDSTLPIEMIHAGSDAIDRATDDMANYVSGETIDWDSGMMAVAVYRAMLAAAPSPEAELWGAYARAICESEGRNWLALDNPRADCERWIKAGQACASLQRPQTTAPDSGLVDRLVEALEAATRSYVIQRHAASVNGHSDGAEAHVKPWRDLIALARKGAA